VNRNTIIAIFLILVVVTLFSSETYNKFFYENIYPRKPYITQKKEITNRTNDDQVKKDSIIQDKSENDTIKNNEIAASTDSIKTDSVFVETDDMVVCIDEKGASIVSIQIKKYKYNENKSKNRKKGEYIDLIPENSGKGMNLSINKTDYTNKIFKRTIDEKNVRVTNNDEKIVQFEIDENGQKIIKEYVFKNGSYKIGCNIIKNDLAGKNVEMRWDCGVEESEKNKPMQPEIRTAHYSDGKNSQHLQFTKEEKESSSGSYKWTGITSKYFFIAIVNESNKDADIAISSFKMTDEILNKKNNGINYKVSYSTIADNKKESFWIYAGPNDYIELKKYNLAFDNNLFPVLSWAKWLFFSDKWFPSLAEGVLWLLIHLYNLVKDYGITIFLLTLIVKLVTYPMTYSSMKSMSRMRDLQPKITQLREKHKNNPRKMNEEMMALYKKEGINPLNPGCLPMFLQMPIFISLFVVLRKAIELRGAETFIIPWINDLSKPEMIFQLPFTIPMYGDNFAVLPIIMAVLTYFQNKMTIKDPNQKAMIYFMPPFMLVLFNSFSSGLVLYWTLSSVFAIIQQVILDKQLKKTVNKNEKK
jgi:YidC/Oxa1 family membrane protein insertase